MVFAQSSLAIHHSGMLLEHVQYIVAFQCSSNYSICPELCLWLSFTHFSHIGQLSPSQGALHNLPFLPYNYNPPIYVSSIVHSWFILSVDQHPCDTLFVSLTETLNHWGFVVVVLGVEFCSCNAVSPKHRRFPGT